MKAKSRIYICHTYYHAYVAFLKECKLKKQHKKNNILWIKADIMLSSLSNDFGQLKERMEQTEFFNQVLELHEKSFDEFPELLTYKKDKGNIVLNMISRIIFTKKYGKLVEPCVPVNLKEYQDIYVFCDSDPIGYYLNYKKIRYHAVEDGLNCIQFYDTARFDNKGSFKLKAWMSARNLIFIQNGYGKYCIDMEVNQIDVLPYPCKKYIEEPRQALVDNLTEEDKQLIVKAFIENVDSIYQLIHESPNKDNLMMILTEPLCTLDVRKKIFGDIAEIFGQGAIVFFKPHPRDLLDYKLLFPQYVVLDGKFPMEVLNFMEGITFNKVYSVLTEVKAISFARQCIKLGNDFLDAYESPEIHRQNEHLT